VERSLEELEAEYLGVSVECLHSIRYGDQWGHRVLRFGEKRKKKRKPARRLRGNRYVKFREVTWF
jgi:hypothetical protein